MSRTFFCFLFVILRVAACGGDDDNMIVAPSDLKAEPGSPAPSVHLTWKDNATNESHFMVERKTGEAAFEVVRNMIPFDPNQNVNQYHDTKVRAGVSYTYRVAAVTADGKTNHSAASSITLP